jgi:hypothetical protein
MLVAAILLLIVPYDDIRARTPVSRKIGLTSRAMRQARAMTELDDGVNLEDVLFRAFADRPPRPYDAPACISASTLARSSIPAPQPLPRPAMAAEKLAISVGLA